MDPGKNNTDISTSLGRQAWKKMKRNPSGVAGMSIIAFLVIISISAYLITPDSTPFSNSQILEFSRKKPGFSGKLLLVRQNRPVHKTNFFNKMIYGEVSPYKAVPYKTYIFKDGRIYLSEFNNKGEDTIYLNNYNIADVVYPIDKVSGLKIINDSLIFTDIYGKAHAESLYSLREKAGKQLISRSYLLGSDRYGRDVLSMLIIGTRVSLSVGFISVGISLIIGILLGSIAGYFRGRADDIILWFINVVWSIPTLLLVIAITFALGKGFWQVFVAVGLTMWVEVARLVRGQVISIREKEYIEAGKALGLSHFRIIRKHILPNVMAAVIVISAANFASAILLEAGLSFLGIGVQAPMPSWGSMIRENYAYIVMDSAYLAILPGLAIMITVLAFMLSGNALRDALDVRTNISN